MYDWNIEKPDKFLKKFFRSKKHTKEDIEACVDALKFLINNKNDKEASLTLGSMYYTGDIIPQNFSLAKKYYEISANLGSARAGLNLGYIYYYGRCDGKPNYEMAFQCFSKAANDSFEEDDVRSEALYKLSDLYWNGLYVKEDKEYAKKLVYSLLDEENFKCGNGEPNVLGDILVRLATFTSKEFNFNYDVYSNYKYARLARKVISDRYDGTWWGDKKVLDKLDILNKNIDEYCQTNNISFNYSIENPKDYKVFTWSESILHWECEAIPIGFAKSKIDEGKLCLLITTGNEYVSIPEIGYCDRADVIFLVFENCELEKNEFNRELYGKFNLCSKKNGFMIFIGDKCVAEVKQDHKSKVYIGQIDKIMDDDTIITKREDFNLQDYLSEREVDA